ncbi:MAG: diguanylate cyclase/phosphodiesterase (GGDEF & EAL domains) with PAS/PAC sensor(s) [uncultured Quadrisphaera sp.]|uniref:Diguanylate cyclase/phosphodiesterase (GGDEF & EAL domains) with PAS/PAC sensor(S) n=1 Tax=uncultured Quadrisphaera sp. TaxID=904978 RepID=A0A6J4NJB9_9ACTN|nr:MAG: diguanylate cyclase/phosphodiesterase (GGDEF & EAL domains) with PAS/PAC sensor(s) [uncultured Quadrisphaera sp.]
MSNDCVGCTCTRARTTGTSGRLVLATQVDHTATALRSLARRKGTALDVLAPGLLSLRADDLDAFVADARRELSSVEAEEVRCLVAGQGDLDAALLAQAMTSPSLAVAGARVQHADLVPLFEDEEGSFHAVYQPIVDLRDGRRVGAEALLRATAPDGSPVTPDVLFPAAHAAGWTHLLDRVGRTTALRDAGPWLGEELLFINFVPTSIYRPEVCLRTTEAAARKAGVRLDQVVFEVTEGHEVRDLDHLEHVFAYYRSRDCKVALDDVGAGYSSLNMLVRLQPDIVKLDKDIVQALPDPVSSAVVTAIVGITHAYGGLVLAECVETAEQASAALDLGVDLGQGWFFGRPERPVGGEAPQSLARVPSAVAVDPARPDAAVAVPVEPPVAPPAAPSDGAGELGPLELPAGSAVALSGLLRRAVDAGVGGVVVVDVLSPEQPLIYVNPAFEAMTGYSSSEVLGRNCRLLQGPGTDLAGVRALRDAVRHGQEHHAVLRNYRKDGSAWWNELHLSPVRDEQWHLTHYLGFQTDVTARVEAEEQLQHQAAHDGLTGLANRSAMLERLDDALAGAARDGTGVAVLFVDLDGFKAVNDSAGHRVGDAVLEQVAQRLGASLRSSDVLARAGGDEFVAILTGLDPLDAARVAHRAGADVVAALERPITVGGTSVRVSASVGVALHPDDAGTGEELLSRADAAMYRAKAAGEGRVRGWTTATDPAAR